MKIGIIGAGRAGCSIGKYITVNSDLDTLTGFYNRSHQKAVEAADFCNTTAFDTLEELVSASNTLFITVNDSQIKNVWDCIDKNSLENKIICHFSGSISSDVFADAESYGAYVGSVHPVYAFNNRFDSYKNMNGIVFTIEGHPIFLDKISELFSYNGNRVCFINKNKKPLYHAAASMASNHLLGLLNMSVEILQECGFSKKEAYRFLKPLMLNNLNSAFDTDVEGALTGPIERGDLDTVIHHLEVLDDHQRAIYKALGLEILDIAQRKNYNKADVQKYSQVKKELLK